MVDIIPLVALAVLFQCIVLDSVEADCIVRVPQNTKHMPIYRRHFGSRTVIVDNYQFDIVLSEQEHLSVFCAAGFQKGLFQSNHYNEDFLLLKDVNIFCNQNQLLMNKNQYIDSNDLKCQGKAWGLYEPETTIRLCEPTVATYMLATPTLSDYFILAVVCIDLYTMSLRTLHYAIGPMHRNAFTSPSETPILSLSALSSTGLEIKNYDSILKIFNDDSTVALANPTNRWLKLANYHMGTIVKSAEHTNYLGNYGTLADMIWWPGLEYGNWQRYTDAFLVATNITAYKVYAGSAGAVLAPSEHKCRDVDHELLVFGTANHTIPAYVWNYLQSWDGSDEVVVVGYNSPFFDLFPAKDIIFCEDICGKIEWLHNATAYFRSSALGVIFCCSAEEARASLKLDGFPFLLPNPKLDSTRITTSTTSVPTTTNANDYQPIGYDRSFAHIF